MSTLEQIDTSALGDVAKLRSAAPAPGAADQRMRMDFVGVDQLRVNRGYQRRLSESGKARIRKIVSSFSWARFGAINVAALSGTGELAILDGQHRAIAAAILQLRQIPACIQFSLNATQQAEDFVGLNTERGGLAPIDRFRARVAAKEPLAITVSEILVELKLSADVPAGTTLRPDETRATTSIERAVKKHGRETTIAAIGMLKNAQPDARNLLLGFNIEALSLALSRKGSDQQTLQTFERMLASADLEKLKLDAGQLVKLDGGKLNERGADLLLREFAITTRARRL